jgi:hypothetical protein
VPMAEALVLPGVPRTPPVMVEAIVGGVAAPSTLLAPAGSVRSLTDATRSNSILAHQQVRSRCVVGPTVKTRKLGKQEMTT